MNKSNLIKLTPAIVSAKNLDDAIAKAIADAKQEGCALGIIVALLHAHAYVETKSMVDRY
jgi:hypothetical protein